MTIEMEILDELGMAIEMAIEMVNICYFGGMNVDVAAFFDVTSGWFDPSAISVWFVQKGIGVQFMVTLSRNKMGKFQDW